MSDSPGRQFRLTRFPSQSAQHKRDMLMSYTELRDLVRAQKGREKAMLPWLKAAVFGKLRTQYNSLRHDANVVVVTGVEADYDLGSLPIEDARDLLTEAGIEALLYESPSATETNHRWRIVAFFDKEITGTPEQLKALRAEEMAKLNAIFGTTEIGGKTVGVLDQGCFDLSRAFYYGTVVTRATPIKAMLSDGAPIDTLDLPKLPKVGRTQSDYSGGEQDTDIVDMPWHQFAKIVMSLPNTEENSVAPTRDEWFKIAGAIHHQSEGGEEGRLLLHQWSALHPSYENNGEARVDNDWRHMRSERGGRVTTGRYILRLADPSVYKEEPDRTMFDDEPETGQETGQTDEGYTDFAESILRATGHWKEDKEADTEEDYIGDGPEDVGQAPLEWMNSMHAVCQIAEAGALVLTFRPNGDVGIAASHAITPLYLNVRAPQAKTPSDNIFKWWLQHPKRRTYRGLVFKPGVDTEPKQYNYWRGFAVQPDPDHSKCELLINHIQEVIADNNEAHFDYVIKWMAHAVQRPGHKPGVAQSWVGKKGTGKDAVAYALGLIFGMHYVQIPKLEQLLGRFNEHEAKALLLHVPDAIWGGDHKMVGPLNNLVTQTATQMEEKYLAKHSIESFSRLIITSNEDWVIPASADERRWSILRVSEKRMGDTDYFDALWHEIDGGVQGAVGPGIPAFLDYLQKVDLTGFNVRAFPLTQELSRQKERTLTNIARYVRDLLMDGDAPASAATAGYDDTRDWDREPVQVFRDVIVEEYEHWHRKMRWQNEVEPAHIFGKELRHLIPSVSESRPRTDGKRPRIYVLPPLSVCRKEFEKATKTTPEWPPIEDNGDDLI